MKNNLRPRLIAAGRAMAGLDQPGLAELAGVSRKSIERAEAGRPGPRTWPAIVAGLERAGVAIDEGARSVRLLEK